MTVHSYAELLADQPDEFDWPVVDENSAAAMCYTSGTTGDPKGVVYTHRSIWLHSMQVCMTDSMALTQADRALVIVPQFHAMSWGLPYAALMVGASLIMPDRFLQPEPLAAIIAAEKPTMAGAVPTIWQGLLAQLDQKPQDLAPLSRAIVGGSAVPPSLMAAFDKLGVTIIHAWGMTETSPLGSVSRPPGGVSGDDAWEYRILQGRFPASVRARLIDDDGNELPWDNEAVGELEVRRAVGRGVVLPRRPPVRTVRRSSADGWLRTGDVGAITPDGFLRLTDRSKDIIKSGGEWISSVDLENAVMAHPAVAEAAVVGVPDEKWSERPLVAVVLRPGESATPAELQVVPDGQGRQVAAAGELDVHRRGAEDERRQVRQEADPCGGRGRHARHHAPVVTAGPESVSGSVTDEAATAMLHQTVPFAAHLGIEVVAASPTAVTGRVAWQESLCTAGGALNGGVIMALADNLGALCAFLNLPAGSGGTTTIESKTNFLRAIRSGHATAVARPLHVGRRIIVVESDVLDDEKRLVARVTQSQAVL